MSDTTGNRFKMPLNFSTNKAFNMVDENLSSNNNEIIIYN